MQKINLNYYYYYYNYAKACGKKLTIQFDDTPITQADIDNGKLKLVKRDATGAVSKQHA